MADQNEIQDESPGNVSVSEQDPEMDPKDPVMNRRTFIAAGTVAAAGAIGAAVYFSQKGELPPATDLISHFRAGDIPLEDPDHPLWDDIAPFAVTLNPQAVTQPGLAQVDVSALSVRSVNNGKMIAFLLNWKDDAIDEVEAIDRFRDAVAIQVPILSPEPVVFMGAAKSPVQIFQWKASWQEDMENGFHDVKKTYPNMFEDVTPESQFPDKAVDFYPGISTGNILSQTKHKSAVESLIAEGFGTLTTLDEQKAKGRGVFAGGGWNVVISFALNQGEGRIKIGKDEKKPIAFAVWNGGKQNRGARKQYANWQTLEVRSV